MDCLGRCEKCGEYINNTGGLCPKCDMVILREVQFIPFVYQDYYPTEDNTIQEDKTEELIQACIRLRDVAKYTGYCTREVQDIIKALEKLGR